MASGQETDIITIRLANQLTIRFDSDNTVRIACDIVNEDSESFTDFPAASPIVWIAVAQLVITGADFAIRHGPGFIEEIQRLMTGSQDDQLILLDHEVAMLRGIFDQCLILNDGAG